MRIPDLPVTETLNDNASMAVDEIGQPTKSIKIDKMKEIFNDGYSTTAEITISLDTKVDKVVGKELSSNDYTNLEKTKLSTVEENANNYELPSDVVVDADLLTPNVTSQASESWNSVDESLDVWQDNAKTLIDGHSVAIDSLATASMEYTYDSDLPLTTVEQKIPIVALLPSSNADIMSIDDVNHQASLLVDARYSYYTYLSVENSSQQNHIMHLITRTSGGVLLTDREFTIPKEGVELLLLELEVTDITGTPLIFELFATADDINDLKLTYLKSHISAGGEALVSSYVKKDGTTPITAPQKGVDGVDVDDLATVGQTTGIKLDSVDNLPIDPSIIPDGTKYILDEIIAGQNGDCCVGVVVKDGAYKLIKPTVVYFDTNLTHQVTTAEVGTEITLATIDVPSTLLNKYIKLEGLFSKDITTTGSTSINVRASGYGIMQDTITSTGDKAFELNLTTFKYNNTLGYKYTSNTMKSGALIEKPFAAIANTNQVSLTISVNDEMFIDLKSISVILK